MPGKQRAPGGKQQHPKQQRTFMAAPHRCQLELPRQQAIAMLRDINDREIADEKTIRQYAKGEQQERELRQNADASESHHGRPAQPHSREGRQRGQHVDPET